MKRTAFTKKRPIIPILRTYSTVEAPNLLIADMDVSFAEQALDVKKNLRNRAKLSRYGVRMSTYPRVNSLFGFQIGHTYDNVHMGVEKIPGTCLSSNWSETFEKCFPLTAGFKIKACDSRFSGMNATSRRGGRRKGVFFKGLGA